ncbi:MAG: hypothetical protein JJT95_04580 [Pararhodobacter sp.]|nr:hypothetical protein [Pararhodobacter sp.]
MRIEEGIPKSAASIPFTLPGGFSVAAMFCPPGLDLGGQAPIVPPNTAIPYRQLFHGPFQRPDA